MNTKTDICNIPVTVSVPCRIDAGGTLDLSTFFLPLNRACPGTFNAALNMRTRVTLSAFDSGWVKISSRGFEPAVYKSFQAPYNHPMGLMFAVADFFNADGIHVQIDSASPPKSALGGSSAAAVAMVAAFLTAQGEKIQPARTAWLAHYIESSVAGVPCGMQDQLAAAFGGVNQWTWVMGDNAPQFRQTPLLTSDADIEQMNDCMLVAYCGNPHESKNINGQWVQQFVSGQRRESFFQIAGITRLFSRAVCDKDWKRAAVLMNQETELRLDMTPDVLDNMGQKLFSAAKSFNCGARFTGAGGGGCVWAVGLPEHILDMKKKWINLTRTHESAGLLDTRIDCEGILVHE